MYEGIASCRGEFKLLDAEELATDFAEKGGMLRASFCEAEDKVIEVRLLLEGDL